MGKYTDWALIRAAEIDEKDALIQEKDAEIEEKDNEIETMQQEVANAVTPTEAQTAYAKGVNEA